MATRRSRADFIHAESHMSTGAARIRPVLKQKPAPVARRCVGKSAGK